MDYNKKIDSLAKMQACCKALLSPELYTNLHYYKITQKKSSYSDETGGEHISYTYYLLSYRITTKHKKYWPV